MQLLECNDNFKKMSKSGANFPNSARLSFKEVFLIRNLDLSWQGNVPYINFPNNFSTTTNDTAIVLNNIHCVIKQYSLLAVSLYLLYN